MVESALASIIKTFAPTVADRLIPMIKDHKMRRDELEMIQLALVAEQNSQTLKLMIDLQATMESLQECMVGIDQHVRENSEGITVLLKRTAWQETGSRAHP